VGPPLALAIETEKLRHRARAFRRWLARGAQPGGLRGLARSGGADERHRARTR
jgi:hypothetical protein